MLLLCCVQLLSVQRHVRDETRIIFAGSSSTSSTTTAAATRNSNNPFQCCSVLLIKGQYVCIPCAVSECCFYKVWGHSILFPPRYAQTCSLFIHMFSFSLSFRIFDKLWYYFELVSSMSKIIRTVFGIWLICFISWFLYAFESWQYLFFLVLVHVSV